MKQHHYQITTQWTGNQGTGTSDYKAYNRSHMVSGAAKAIEIPCSSDPSFNGDPTRYNPEELLVAALSACHMLWYLHLCAVNGVVVMDYRDKASGIMEEWKNHSGKFESVTLYPLVIVTKEAMVEKAMALHHQAHEMCFIANSCNFEVKCKPKIIVN